MVTEQQVLYLTYLKDTYGQDLKAFMQLQLSQHALAVVDDTISFGLLPQTTPGFYEEFAKAGGDADYLQFAVQCFLQVRQELLNTVKAT